jgi:hypothetical protein
LYNQQYCYLNTQYSKDEYENILQSLPKMLNKGWEGFTDQGIKIGEHRNAMILGSESCFGHKIINSQYCIGRNIENAQHCKYIDNATTLSDTYDGLGTGYSQHLAYEIIDTGVNNFRNIACLVVHNSTDVYYAFSCYHCSNCF